MLASVLAAAAIAVGPPGSLTPVAGAAGCIVAQQTPVSIPCTRVRQLRLDAVLASPDGRNLYTLGGIDTRSALAVMRRDPRTGAVRQLEGRAGCLVADWGGHGTFPTCTPAHLNKPNAFAITPDGRELVYLNGAGSYGLNAYNRSPETGALSSAGCCGAVRALACPSDVATSPDGRNVYTVSSTCTGHGLSVLVRDPASGKLRQPEGAAGCIQRIAADGCALAPSKAFSPREVEVTPDGAEVYVAAGGGLFVFARSRPGGTLKPRVCYLPVARRPCHALSELASDLMPFGRLDLAPDGRNLYVVERGRIVVLRRAPSGVLSQLPPPRGCVTPDGDGGRCVAARVLAGGEPLALTFSPDGRTVYGGRETGEIVVLRRDPADGSLAQLPAPYGRIRLGASPGGRTVSPDGRFVYVAGALPPRGQAAPVYGLRVLRRAR
jgi:DNA-binding beta-propeller fold protein YncE